MIPEGKYLQKWNLSLGEQTMSNWIFGYTTTTSDNSRTENIVNSSTVTRTQTYLIRSINTEAANGEKWGQQRQLKYD